MYNHVMPFTYYIPLIFILKPNYIRMYVKDRLDLLKKKIKLIIYNLHNEIIKSIMKVMTVL